MFYHKFALGRMKNFRMRKIRFVDSPASKKPELIYKGICPV